MRLDLASIGVHTCTMTGRPTLLTPEIERLVLDELLDWGTTADAAAQAGVNVDTIRHWIREGARAQRDLDANGTPIPANRVAWVDFSAAVKMAKAMARKEALGGVRLAAKEGNWQAGAWFLERTDPANYARRTATEISGPEGGPVQVVGTVAECIEAAIAATPGLVLDDE